MLGRREWRNAQLTLLDAFVGTEKRPVLLVLQVEVDGIDELHVEVSASTTCRRSSISRFLFSIACGHPLFLPRHDVLGT